MFSAEPNSTKLQTPAIIIGRPEPYASNLQQQLEQQLNADSTNLHLFKWPLIDFKASDLLANKTNKTSFLKKITESDLMIFVSRQAARFCLEPLNSIEKERFRSKILIAVGAGTQKALDHFTLNSLIPETPDSEGIIALIERLHLKKPIDKICLIRGDQGRTLMENTLPKKHELTIFQSYHRTVLEQNNETLKQIQQIPTPKLVIATSQQILQLALDNIPKSQHNDFCYLCISERIDAFAEKMSIKSRIIAKNASNNAIIESVLEWLEPKHLNRIK